MIGIDPGLGSGAVVQVSNNDTCPTMRVAAWSDGRVIRAEVARGDPPYLVGAPISLVDSWWPLDDSFIWCESRPVRIEQPLTVGRGRIADTWRSVGRWEQTFSEYGCVLVPMSTYLRAHAITGRGRAEVREQVKLATPELDALLADRRWGATRREAVREAYLLATAQLPGA